MNTLPAFSRILATILIAFTLSLPAFSEPENLTQLTDKVKAYHDSGAYQSDIANKIHQAKVFILEKVALNRKKSRPEKLAVVLDIDETSISSYDKMVARYFAPDKDKLYQEVLEADAPAITATLSLYQTALNNGVDVFFVTGRNEHLRQATQDNLKRVGYKHWTGLYLKPDNYHHRSIIPFKSEARAKITKLGYKIIATIGDQYSDLKGGYAEKAFKLPNPYYYLP